MSDRPNTRRYRILVLGAGGVGKSAITRRYVHNEYIDVYDPTVEDSFLKIVNHPDHGLTELEIVDTAGYDQFIGFKEIQLKEADGIVIVFSIDSSESLQMAKLLLREVRRSREDDRQAVIVIGNKLDLREAEVKPQTVENFYVEQKVKLTATSARLNKNIDGAFDWVLRKCVEKNPDPHPRQRKKTSWWRKFGSKGSN